MNNDLISREALKIEIEKQIAYCDDKSKHQSDMEEVLRYSNTSYGLRLAHNYVDNAPTVEAVTVEHHNRIKGILQNEIDSLVKIYDTERPQGKWEEPFENNGKTYHKCNRCHISSELILIDRFCPSCGAYMWKGGEE